MGELVELLWSYRWWAWFDPERPLFSYVYRGLNLAEATAWVVVAMLVLRRWQATRGSRFLEPSYALAYFAFGLSDLREACVLQGWLIVVKLMILAVLIVLRRKVLRLHPRSRAF